jgi:transcriptional regulator with XRE-family HTH domain
MPITKTPQKIIDRIIELGSQGKTQREISEDTGVTQGTVWKYLKLRDKEVYKDKNKNSPPPSDSADYTEEKRECQEVREEKTEIIEIRGKQAEIEKEGGKQSNIDNLVEEKKKGYVSKLDKLINLLLQRYENDYYRVHPNFLSRDIGIFIDKVNILTGTNPTVDNRSIIFASFGDNKEMLKMIEAIQSSKGTK